MTAPAVEKLLDALGPPEALDFPKLLIALHTARYTGSITLHCRNGRPQQLDLGAPIRLSICEALDTPPRDPPP